MNRYPTGYVVWCLSFMAVALAAIAWLMCWADRNLTGWSKDLFYIVGIGANLLISWLIDRSRVRSGHSEGQDCPRPLDRLDPYVTSNPCFRECLCDGEHVTDRHQPLFDQRDPGHSLVGHHHLKV